MFEAKYADISLRRYLHDFRGVMAFGKGRGRDFQNMKILRMNPQMVF